FTGNRRMLRGVKRLTPTCQKGRERVMRRFLKPVLIALPIVVLATVAGAYVHDEIVASSHVSRGVSAAGHEISRLSEADAVQVIASHEAKLLGSPVELVIGEKTVELQPGDVALSID